MATLRDFIAYARTYIHPKLSEEAGQALVQAYVGTSLPDFTSTPLLPYFVQFSGDSYQNQVIIHKGLIKALVFARVRSYA